MVFGNNAQLIENVIYDILQVDTSYKNHETYWEKKLNSYFEEEIKSTMLGSIQVKKSGKSWKGRGRHG